MYSSCMLSPFFEPSFGSVANPLSDGGEERQRNSSLQCSAISAVISYLAHYIGHRKSIIIKNYIYSIPSFASLEVSENKSENRPWSENYCLVLCWVFFLSETQLCVSFSMEKRKIPVHLGKPQLLHKDSLAQVAIREK